MSQEPTRLVKRMAIVIKTVAEELGLNVTEPERADYQFEIEDSRWHTVAWKIFRGPTNYLQVHLWQDVSERTDQPISEDLDYSRTIMSLRTMSDAVKFCSMMTSALELRARR